MNQTAQETADILGEFGIARERIQDGDLEVRSPIDGAIIGRVRTTNARALSQSIHVACRAFLEWRTVPAPVRGELVRLLGEELRSNKTALGRLVTIESGKIVS
ncbi:MAG: aldehyde dehydrogenase family protein, partial [Acidobacteriaceae bacterium]|nr:aldehyde dehydrogenase family protein [Acidobacteriaceae bacterium]